MNKPINSINVARPEKRSSKHKGFLERQADRLKNGQFTCPFCKEVLIGISDFGAHLKQHCT
jgi:hypothetical protein